ncbi:MAG: succinyldiaminopimelate transaminase [Acidimicrobiia bacterium]|nr:MAG: succinyldiaminopimelate transaminase [Acidimicrobiia bacterium]
MRVNPVLEKVGPSPIAAIQERARSLREQGLRLIDFSIGDPREPTPEFIRHALRDAVPEISQYPSTRGTRALREAIAGYVGRRFGVEVDPDTQVLPTSGSKEAIFSTPLAFVDRAAGDAVVWPTPGYPIYERGALLAGAEGVPISLGDDFVFRADTVPAEVWHKVRIVWVCTPHNPAGTVTSMEELARFVELCRRFDALLCSDECYVDLYDRDPPPSALQAAGRGSRNVLVYLSLSKRSGMTGYRSGAVVGDPEAIARLVELRTSTGTAPPEFTQAAAVAAWSDDRHVAERRELFRRKRRILREAFSRAGFRVVGSEAGLYLWVRVDDDLQAAERLLNSGVVVSPGRIFGEGGEGHLRLALVPPLEDCERAAEVVVECLTRT